MSDTHLRSSSPSSTSNIPAPSGSESGFGITSNSNTRTNSSDFKTTIIISNLDKYDFVNDHSSYTASRQLTFVDSIKLAVLNLSPPKNHAHGEFGDDYYLNNIKHWSNLSSLSRIIIIFKTDESAQNVYDYLHANLVGDLKDIDFSNHQVKLSLQDNLLARSKSFDSLIKSNGNSNSLSVTKSLSNFKSFYNQSSKNPIGSYDEPEPKQFNVYDDLTKMGIDLSSLNNDEQLHELKNGTSPNSSSPSSPPSKSPVLENSFNDERQSNSGSNGILRSKSLTKTLFKPNLNIDTSHTKRDLKPNFENQPPESPTITLDESF